MTISHPHSRAALLAAALGAALAAGCAPETLTALHNEITDWSQCPSPADDYNCTNDWNAVFHYFVKPGDREDGMILDTVRHNSRTELLTRWPDLATRLQGEWDPTDDGGTQNFLMRDFVANQPGKTDTGDHLFGQPRPHFMAQFSTEFTIEKAGTFHVRSRAFAGPRGTRIVVRSAAGDEWIALDEWRSPSLAVESPYGEDHTETGVTLYRHGAATLPEAGTYTLEVEHFQWDPEGALKEELDRFSRQRGERLADLKRIYEDKLKSGAPGLPEAYDDFLDYAEESQVELDRLQAAVDNSGWLDVQFSFTEQFREEDIPVPDCDWFRLSYRDPDGNLVPDGNGQYYSCVDHPDSAAVADLPVDYIAEWVQTETALEPAPMAYELAANAGALILHIRSSDSGAEDDVARYNPFEADDDIGLGATDWPGYEDWTPISIVYGNSYEYTVTYKKLVEEQESNLRYQVCKQNPDGTEEQPTAACNDNL